MGCDVSLGRKKIRKDQKRTIALHRMRILFQLAEKEALKQNYQRSHRYVLLARRISMKTQTSIPKEFKRCFCKHCYKYLVPGKTGRVRIQHGKIIMFCSYCKKFQRIALYPKK